MLSHRTCILNICTLHYDKEPQRHYQQPQQLFPDKAPCQEGKLLLPQRNLYVSTGILDLFCQSPAIFGERKHYNRSARVSRFRTFCLRATNLEEPEIFTCKFGPSFFLFFSHVFVFFFGREVPPLYFNKHRLNYSRVLFYLEGTCSAVRTTCQLHRV